MKAETKAKWLEALRSGKYKQGRGFLRIGENFCCLGVLHDVTGGNWHTKDGIILTGSINQKNSHCGYLVGTFLQGLSKNIARDLATLNDKGSTFSEIADYIEKNVITSETK